MNDTAPKQKRKLLLPAVLGIVALLIIGFMVSRAGLDKALVRQRLDSSIVAMKERAKLQGRDIDIRYGDIEMAGGLMDRHVIVRNPVFTVKPLERAPLAPDALRKKTDTLMISTAQMVLYPKSTDLSSALISLPDPLNFATEEEPEKSLMKLQASTPLEVLVNQRTVDGVPRLQLSHQLPAKLDFTYLHVNEVQGTEDATPELTPVYETLNVAVAPGSSIATDMTQDGSSLGTVDVDIKQITLTPAKAPEGVITIAGIENRWNNVLTAENMSRITTTAKVGPITAPEGLMPNAPYAFSYDLAVEGPAVKAQAAANPEGETRNSTLVLKELTLSSKESTLTAQADFMATPSDIMPVGTAAIKLTNVNKALDSLRANQVLKPEMEQFLLPVLERVAGAPLASLTDLDIAVQRERGGAFMIGKTTFEELFAVVLKEMMARKTGGAMSGALTPVPQQRGLTPQLPAADKPRSAPIVVPDNGVRG